MSYLLHLKCRDCGRTYPAEPLAACEACWAPLEPVYDYTRIWSDLRPKDLESRSPNMWRYRELLPLAGEPALPRAPAECEHWLDTATLKDVSADPQLHDEIVDLVAASPRFAPHLHLPLQHASDRMHIPDDAPPPQKSIRHF